MTALCGRVTVNTLDNSDVGRAAMARDSEVTRAIQSGTASQPTSLPLAVQQQLALRDAFITDGNAFELAVGLGSDLATRTSADVLHPPR